MAYHHGDARAALLRAARDALALTDAGSLSLRQVAEQAGLSRQAPYNHFANKEALLAELAQDGFVALAALIDGDLADLAPVDRLAAAAARYIEHGVENPALFRLMFSKERVDLCRYPEAEAAAAGALARLSAIVAALDPGRDPTDATLVAWSLVHGYTDLCIELGLEPPARRAARARLFARTVAALVAEPAIADPRRTP